MLPEHTSIVLQTDVSTTIGATVADVIAFLPGLVGTVIVLRIGWVVGVAVGNIDDWVTPPSANRVASGE